MSYNMRVSNNIKQLMIKSDQPCHDINSRQYVGFCKINKYVTQIHSQLMVVGSTFAHRLSEEEYELLGMFEQGSMMGSVLNKCMEIKDRLTRIVGKEKQLTCSSLGVLKQIQSYLIPVNNYHNKEELLPRLVQNYTDLTNLINQLPFAQITTRQDKTKIIQKSRQVSEDFDHLLEEVQILRTQKAELEMKIKDYEEATSSIEQKLRQLFEHSIQEEIKMDQKGRVIERICQNVYRQHFMIQANFDIRNQFYFLKTENQKLKAQIVKNRDIIEAMKKKHDYQLKYLRSANQKLSNDNIHRSSTNLVKSIKQLQQKMGDLENLRLRDERTIKNLHLKVQSLKSTKQPNQFSTFAKNKQPKHFTKHFPASVQYEFGQVDEPQRAYSYKPHEKQHKKIKTQQQIKYSKSTCVLLQPFQTPKSKIRQGRQLQFNENFIPTNLRGSNEQDLKTSGFFLQPEDYSYFSNQTDKRRDKHTMKRAMQCKTPSTLS